MIRQQYVLLLRTCRRLRTLERDSGTQEHICGDTVLDGAWGEKGKNYS